MLNSGDFHGRFMFHLTMDFRPRVISTSISTSTTPEEVFGCFKSLYHDKTAESGTRKSGLSALQTPV